MATHVHFHDFLSGDAYDPNEKRDPGGKWSTSGGSKAQTPPGTGKAGVHAHAGQQHQTPQQSQSRLPSRGQAPRGAAAAIAAAFERSKGLARSVGREAFGVEGDIETLTRGLENPNSPITTKVNRVLTQNIPRLLGDMVRENRDTVVHGIGGLKAIANGVPRTEEQTKAFRAAGIKLAIVSLKVGLTAVGIPVMIPGVGAVGHLAGHAVGSLMGHGVDSVTQHVLEQAANQVAEHGTEEHIQKLGGAGVRAAVSRPRPQPGGDDHAYRDAAGISPEDMKLLADYMQTLNKYVVPAIVSILKAQTQAKANGGDSTKRFGPMFGGLKSSGNRLKVGDEGTSAGALKGWQHRLHHQAGETELRKTTPHAAAGVPSFAEMQAHRYDLEPGAGVTKPKPKPKHGQRHTTPARTPEEGMVSTMPKKGQAPPGVGYKVQAKGVFQGKKRTEATAPKPQRPGRRPGARRPVGAAASENALTRFFQQRQNVSQAQRGREGAAREQHITGAQRGRAELEALERKMGPLTEAEKKRKDRLTREHRGGKPMTRTERRELWRKDT